MHVGVVGVNGPTSGPVVATTNAQNAPRKLVRLYEATT